MKNNKGITLIALIIMVILLAILSMVTVKMGVSITGSAKFESIETNLLLIQGKVKKMSQDLVLGEIDTSDLKGTPQGGEDYEGDYEGWYLLSQEDLNEMGVTKAKAEDGYYVNYATDDVAYAKGISLDGVTFKYLSDILSYTKK